MIARAEHQINGKIAMILSATGCVVQFQSLHEPTFFGEHPKSQPGGSSGQFISAGTEAAEDCFGGRQHRSACVGRVNIGIVLIGMAFPAGIGREVATFFGFDGGNISGLTGGWLFRKEYPAGSTGATTDGECGPVFGRDAFDGG